MNQLLTILFFSATIATSGCGNRQEVDIRKELNKNDSLARQNIPVLFGQPNIIDSSHIIIYPLILQRIMQDGGYASSSSYGEKTSYWNLVFYNTETGAKTLLTDNQRISINSFTVGSSSSYSSGSDVIWKEGINLASNSIFYNVVTNDFNQNKTLDEGDPTYLFVSDKEGRGFRQISPDNYDITSWSIVRGTNKVIMQGRSDQNKDKRFTVADREEHFITDLTRGGKATPVFSVAYTDSLRTKFINNWK